ncbi:MAG: MarR family winged helix-turn-helix transcriptional regulator [Aestuariivirgaceae bacterium]
MMVTFVTIKGDRHMPQLQLENFLPYRLSRAAAISSSQLARIYRRTYQLTIPEWRTLATLGQFGEMTAKAVGQHSSMHKTKVSRAVASLHRRRWLKRRTDEADRRIEHLTLTPQGLRAYGRLKPEMLLYEDRLLASLSASERETVLKGVALLEKALGAH